jgi:hypothetical protein
MPKTSYLLGQAVSDEKPDRDLDDDQFISRSIERVNEWFAYFNMNIENAKEDIYFAVINQWDQNLYQERVQEGKACLQINYIYALIASLVGQYRKQTPEFKVYTTTDESNPNAEVSQPQIDLYDGLMRQIFFDNKSEIVFQQAGESALLRGFGAIAVHVEYESDMSFNQVPKFRAIDDPLTCFWDSTAKEATKSDSKFCGEMITYTIQEFNDKFPDRKKDFADEMPSSFPSTQLNRESDSFWRSEEWVRVANMYVKEAYPMQIALLSDGRSLEISEAREEVKLHQEMISRVKSKEKKLKKTMTSLGFGINDNSFLDTHEALEIVDTRDTIDYKIMNYIMSEDEILEEAVWPSKIMPIIFVDGHSQFIEGKQFTKSYHRTAKDAQKIVNYTASEAIENLMNSHKEQWIGTPENFKGYEAMWRNPSLAKGALVANRDQGIMPEQVAPPQISPNFMQLFQQSTQDIKNTLGYFEANTGEQGNEKSGVAINNRAKQGSMASFVYFDNWGRAIEQTAKCVMSLIPSLYDSTRNITVRKASGDQSIVNINKPKGDDYENDLTKGNYGIEVTVGSNYEIQKQENMDSLKDLMATLAPSNPMLVGALADLYAANTDLENTTQIVDRIRQVILGKNPADILREEMDMPEEPKKPNPEDQMMQIEMQLKQGDLQLKQGELQLKAGDQDLKKIELQLQQQEIELKKILAKNEHEKNVIAADKNNVEREKADLSLQEIKATTDAERYHSDANIEVEGMKLAGNMHKSILDAHGKTAEIHKTHLQGLHDFRNNHPSVIVED